MFIMMEVLVMISYIVWICVGITIIGGMIWSLNFQRKSAKYWFNMIGSDSEDGEA